MDTDSLATNTPISPSPKVLDFNEKRLHWAYVVHGWLQKKKIDSWSNICFALILQMPEAEFTSQIFNGVWDLNLGCKELGI